jgi:hypothetical protein
MTFDTTGHNQHSYQVTVSATGFTNASSCNSGSRYQKVLGDGGGCAQRVSAFIMDAGAGRKLVSADKAYKAIDIMVRGDKTDSDCTHEWCWAAPNVYIYVSAL